MLAHHGLLQLCPPSTSGTLASAPAQLHGGQHQHQHHHHLYPSSHLRPGPQAGSSSPSSPAAKAAGIAAAGAAAGVAAGAAAVGAGASGAGRLRGDPRRSRCGHAGVAAPPSCGASSAGAGSWVGVGEGGEQQQQQQQQQAEPWQQPQHQHQQPPRPAGAAGHAAGNSSNSNSSSEERSSSSSNSSSSSSSSRSGATASSSTSSSEGVKPGLLDKMRAMAFFAWSLALSLPLFATMLALAPFVMLMDKYKRLAQHFVNQAWAKVSTSLFYNVEVVGRENLPPADRAVVYVANHQSFLDIYSLFHLDRPFKFISKTSNFIIPIVGWSMFLTGHVMLNRVDRRSQLECLKACVALLGKGAPVLFFPEGTRSKTRVMAGFKKGAFSVAGKAGVDVVPVTLLGTGDLMPSGEEGVLRPGAVKIVVHAPIPTKGRDMGQVCSEAREAIASALPPHLVGSASVMAEGD